MTNILDTVHFAPSKHSRLIQATDLVTFLHHRRWTATNPDPREAKAVDQIWAHVTPRITYQNIWTP